MFNSRCVPVALLGLTIFACSPTKDSPRPTADEDLAALAEARDAVLTALHNDDISGIVAALPEAHLTMAPGAPTVPDNDALRQWHQNRIDLFTFESDHVPEEVILSGDFAIERWSGQSRLTPREEGDVVEDAIKGLWIWQRQADGAWKLLWSVWNSDLPAGTDWNVGEGA